MSVYLILIFLASFVLTYVIKEIGIKKSLVDIPNDRSSHTVPTPHGGGIAISICWFAGITYLYFVNDINSSLYFALLVGVIISIVSYLDDLFELSAKLRLIIQIIVASLGLYFLGGFDKIDLIVFSIENTVITNIFAFLMIVWFINLYNFLDGIDGYAGAEAVFLGLAGFLLFGDSHFLVLVVSVLGFLVWNWHKAKIFMGDVGSTLLGYNIAIFTIYYQNDNINNSESTSVLVWFILFGLFWFDATFTLLRRYKNKEKLSQAHKKHAYQRLVQSGWTHSKVVIYSIILNVILFVFAYLYIQNNSFTLVFFIIVLILLYYVVKYIDKKKDFNKC